jgi:hypothetical protein
MHDRWTDRLSAYLNDEVSPDERVAIEQHLADCVSCRAVRDDLRAIIDAAQSLDRHEEPAADLWPAIAAGIAPGGGRRWQSVWPMALAAGILLAAVSGLAMWVVLGSGRPGVAGAAAGGTPPPSAIVSQPAGLSASAPYGEAVRELLQVLETRRDRLSPRTVQVVEDSLATIDRAIAEATAALERDPGDVALASHITSQRQLKLAVLRRVEKLTVESP